MAVRSMIGYIYKITNKINNKIYIGLTTHSVNWRWQQHINVAKCPKHKDYNNVFKKAIRKYGENNFTVETIDQADSLEELKEKEQYWIKYYNCAYINGGYGYNGTLGGDKPTVAGTQIYKVNIYTNQIEESFDYVADAEKAYPHLDIFSTIDHRSGNGWTEAPPNSGYTFVRAEEYNTFNENTLKEKFNVICQLDLNGKLIKYWNCLNEIERQLGISHGDLSACLSKKYSNRQTAHKCQWCYYNQLQDYLNKPALNARSIVKQKVVYQYDKQKNFIRTFPSLASAAAEYGVQHSAISRACNLPNRTSCGFIWSYTPLHQ